MSRRHARDRDEDDDDDEWDEDDELPDGVYHDDEPATEPCPYCRREVIEGVDRCPYCENYLSAEDAPPRANRTAFWLVMMALALFAAVLWVKP